MYQCKIPLKRGDHCKIFLKANNKGLEIALILRPLQTPRHCQATISQQLSSKREKLKKAIIDRVEKTKQTGAEGSDTEATGKRETEDSISRSLNKDILVKKLLYNMKMENLNDKEKNN